MENNRSAAKKKTKRKFETNSHFASERMKKVKSKGTGLEEAMENILIEIGALYVKQPKLPGHPDFEVQGRQILIFCDGSFWHGRNPDDLSGKNFKRNKELWVEKLTKTKRRDRKVNKELKRQGYEVLRFWDDEILKSPETVKKIIKSSLEVKLTTQ